MKTQRAKFVQGQWIVTDQHDKMMLEWINGFCRLINVPYNETLLDCQPNYDKDTRPISMYIVTISIEAIKDDDLDLHGRYIGK